MATQVPPKKNAAYTFYVSLASQASSHVMQANPTLAAGDVKVATDDAAPANITTLPTVDADFTKRVKVELSASEMNGDNITIIFSDAAGSEWDDLVVNLQTTARQIDDLAYPTVSGRSLDVSSGGEAGVDWANVGSPTTTLNLSGTTIKTATDVETDTQDIQSRLPAALVGGRMDANAGAISGDATAADNAEAFFDGTGYAGTNNVIPTVTTLTNDPSGVTTLLSRIPASLFSGITSLAQWLGLLAGKQTGNSTARTEIRATGAGSGTFDETTDSQEAIRDRGDAAWTTATGFSTLDAAGVRSAVGLASANLDTQLSTIDDFLDTEVAAIKAKTDTLPSSPAAVGSAMTLTSGERNSVADALLDRDMSTGTDSGSATVRTVRQALRLLRNKWDTLSGLRVYKEDDTTISWQSTLTTDGSADPITGSDPASS